MNRFKLIVFSNGEQSLLLFTPVQPYLPHAVVLHSDFSKEEVDVVSIIHCLHKVRLCNKKEQKQNKHTGKDCRK